MTIQAQPSPGDQPSDWISPVEVAAYLHIAYITVIRHLERGTLPGRKVGRQWRTGRRDLERLFGHDTSTAAEEA